MEFSRSKSVESFSASRVFTQFHWLFFGFSTAPTWVAYHDLNPPSPINDVSPCFILENHPNRKKINYPCSLYIGHTYITCVYNVWIVIITPPRNNKLLGINSEKVISGTGFKNIFRTGFKNIFLLNIENLVPRKFWRTLFWGGLLLHLGKNCVLYFVRVY